MQTITTHTSGFFNMKRVFNLQSRTVKQDSNNGGGWETLVTRAAVRKALAALDKGEVTTQLQVSHSGMFSHPIAWNVTKLDRGRIKVGCQIVSAKTIKTIRRWAGVK